MSPVRNAAYTYVPDEFRANIPKLYTTDGESDPTVWVKLFTPDSIWTWYVIEWDGDDLCFGFVAGHEQELGYFSLAEIDGVRGGLGLPVERDLYFTPCPLSRIRERHA
jgi:DUF2958 family protein